MGSRHDLIIVVVFLFHARNPGDAGDKPDTESDDRQDPPDSDVEPAAGHPWKLPDSAADIIEGHLVSGGARVEIVDLLETPDDLVNGPVLLAYVIDVGFEDESRVAVGHVARIHVIAELLHIREHVPGVSRDLGPVHHDVHIPGDHPRPQSPPETSDDSPENRQHEHYYSHLRSFPPFSRHEVD